jgi:hypothetical protein
LLDFAPNHTGLDHPWVKTHPEYYISGRNPRLRRKRRRIHTWVKRKGGDVLFAYGRIPISPAGPTRFN